MKKIIFIFVFIIFASGTYLLSRSEKLNIAESVENQKGVMYWLNNMQTLSANDLQDDDIVNVIYTNNDGYGVIKRLNNEKNPQIEIEFFSSEKKPVAHVREQWQYDVPFPEYLVSKNGDKVLAVDISNRIRVFNNDGKVQENYKIIDKYSYETETIIVNAATDNLDLLFTGMTVPGKKITTLTFRTSANEMIWRESYEGWSVRSVAISNDGRYLAASLYQSGDAFRFRSIIFTANGEIVYESQQRTSGFRFSSDNNFVTLLDKKQLELADLKTRSKTGTYELADADKIIIGADFSDKNILIIQTAEVSRNNKDQFNPWQYIKNSLVSLDMSATQIAKINFEDDWVIHPCLRFDAQRQQFFYGHNAGYRLLNAIQ
ncbi:MAG: hypothetical protein KDF60_07645 [Calditrichaeota bacterium]|nr:hypothetical protein [Calditrichota bacterium]